jgi:NAD(P)H-dependent FMN reductase
LGSIRRNRRSKRPADLLAQRIAAAGHRTELLDLRELALPMFDEEESSEQHAGVAHFRSAMDRADAIVWLSPEYNHAYTSAIKNAIDYLDDEIKRKPSVTCGLSGAAHGGVRASEALKAVLIELHGVPIRESVNFADARNLFDQEGTLLKPEYTRRIDYVVADLAWYARALKWGREHLPVPQRIR